MPVFWAILWKIPCYQGNSPRRHTCRDGGANRPLTRPGGGRTCPPRMGMAAKWWGMCACYSRTRRPETKERGCWRIGRDSNPGGALDPYTLSRRAPSTTRPPIRRGGDSMAWGARPPRTRKRAAPLRTPPPDPPGPLPQQLHHLLLRLVGLRQHRLRRLAEHLGLGEVGRFRRKIGIEDARP